MARDTDTIDQVGLYLEIFKRIPVNRDITCKEILDSLAMAGIEVPLLKLQRALKSIVESDRFGIERNDRSKPFGYRRSRATGFTVYDPTPQESLMFRLVEERLANELPSAILKGLKPLFDKSREVLNEKSRSSKEYEWLKKVAVVPNTLKFLPPAIKPRIFNEVSEALYDEKWLEVKYHNAAGETKTKTVNPLAIVQQGNRIYLICQFETFSNYRHIALHRIENAKETDRPASRPADFSLQHYLTHTEFNYTGDTVRWVHLTFQTRNPQTVAQLEESKFTNDQTIREVRKGVWKVDVPRIVDSILLDGWLKTWGEEAQISLVKKIPISEKTKA